VPSMVRGFFNIKYLSDYDKTVGFTNSFLMTCLPIN